MDWLLLKYMGLEYRVARNGVMGLHRKTSKTEILASPTTMLQPVYSPFQISVSEWNFCLCSGLCDSALCPLLQYHYKQPGLPNKNANTACGYHGSKQTNWTYRDNV